MRCGNSLASTYYNVIWGGRVPVLAEPLLKGATWTSSGGAGNDVASTSRYLGTEDITVPAFDHPVTAAIVRSDITQAGALGDPYGSGIRTIWWVYGVGPAKIAVRARGRRGRAGDDGRAPVDEPDAEGAAAGRRLLPAEEGAQGAATAGRTRST